MKVTILAITALATGVTAVPLVERAPTPPKLPAELRNQIGDHLRADKLKDARYGPGSKVAHLNKIINGKEPVDHWTDATTPAHALLEHNRKHYRRSPTPPKLPAELRNQIGDHLRADKLRDARYGPGSKVAHLNKIINGKEPVDHWTDATTPAHALLEHNRKHYRRSPTPPKLPAELRNQIGDHLRADKLRDARYGPGSKVAHLNKIVNGKEPVDHWTDATTPAHALLEHNRKHYRRSPTPPKLPAELRNQIGDHLRADKLRDARYGPGSKVAHVNKIINGKEPVDHWTDATTPAHALLEHNRKHYRRSPTPPKLPAELRNQIGDHLRADKLRDARYGPGSKVAHLNKVINGKEPVDHWTDATTPAHALLEHNRKHYRRESEIDFEERSVYEDLEALD